MNVCCFIWGSNSKVQNEVINNGADNYQLLYLLNFFIFHNDEMTYKCRCQRTGLEIGL